MGDLKRLFLSACIQQLIADIVHGNWLNDTIGSGGLEKRP